ncbi:MAG: hypothetical protein AB7F22_10450 [Reyranella sp.]|uniref:hypothetical protein n=1 Tax=Reyranella sp. TaxID=1929291 RepID=UPI003D10DDBC
MTTITIYWQAVGWFVLALIVGIIGFVLALAAGSTEGRDGEAMASLTCHVVCAALVGLGVQAWHP